MPRTPDFAEDLIGLDRKEAEELTKSKGFRLRVTRLDGNPCMATRDYRRDRINVAVRDSRVEKILGLG